MTSPPPSREDSCRRRRITVRGAVQGVGFRPHVYRLASELGLAGWVRNSPRGVSIEVEGREQALKSFETRLKAEVPPNASIQEFERQELAAAGFDGFEIRESEAGGERTAVLLADMATCPDCLREVFDPANRRHLYPFTNCTHCGPRYTIIDSLPYDRAHTTMRRFEMCADCRREYEDPLDRRFHAQPNACHACGPQLRLRDAEGNDIASRHDALARALAALREGRIVAVQGLGGFHLFVDATEREAVRRLRRRKRRPAKPFALMLPSAKAIRGICIVSDREERLLASPQSPIVLLRRASPGAGGATVAAEVAPGNPLLGVMLPYTPLHHILMRELDRPVVATSGNLSEEPICFDETEALRRLAGIADLFLVHDRPIARPVDDSVVRVVMDRELPLRRARGYAPLPVRVSEDLSGVLAVGAHLKNTVALGLRHDVFVSPHIGDLEGRPSFEAFERNIACLRGIYEIERPSIACDQHPDYLSTRFARQQAGAGAPRPVQHHFAHVVACMVDNDLDEPVLGVAWDGTGYGPDGTVWGGEFLVASRSGYERMARFRTFRIPGGDAAIREPRRSALGLLWATLGDDAFRRADLAPLRAFRESELRVLRKMLENGLNAPETSSVGRLFDAVACIIGLRNRNHFEGQAAMDLEFAAASLDTASPYELPLAAARPSGEPSRPSWEADWRPMVAEILEDARRGRRPFWISGGFHAALAEAVVAAARRAGLAKVVLTGGCFQNATLLERAVRRLREEGFDPYWHRRVPPNDGGIALGQAVAAHYGVD